MNDPPTISDIANQSTDEDTATGAIPFVVGDQETPAADLVVTATSSNPALVPDGNIVLGGSGANRTVTITPAANLSGSATITITVTDANGASSSDTFVLNVGGVNDPPTISDIANQSTDEDTATGAIPFVVGDLETPAGDLVVTATSSNPALVPDGNIVLGGSGANRTVTITPAANLSGSATITITVTDANGASSSDTFVLNVGGVNDPPTISDIANQSTDEDTATGAIPFVVGDLETPAGDLVVTATSSNPALVPDGNIVLGGSGANRTVTITPAANLSGSATITITVTDANGASSSDTFVLNVGGVNDPPTISDIANQSTDEDTATGAIPFVVGDLETPAGDLVVTATSSNPALVPDGNIVLGGSGANRTVTITPAANLFGSATITITVIDANGGSSSDTFVLTVNAVNYAPEATSDTYTVSPGNILSGNVLLNDSDADGDSLTAIIVASTTKGTLVLNPGGTFSYSPNSTFNGTDSFTYRANDGVLGSDVTTVTINLTGDQRFDAALTNEHVDIGSLMKMMHGICMSTTRRSMKSTKLTM